jgi:putative salt-induced outer membrane protein YdiY
VEGCADKTGETSFLCGPLFFFYPLQYTLANHEETAFPLQDPVKIELLFMQTVSPYSHAVLICFFIFFFLVLPGQGMADEVHLKNGDRITGRVLKKENGTVSLETAYAGTLTIQWQDVARITTESPIEVYLHNETLTVTSVIAAGPVAEEGVEDVIQASEIKYINPPPYISGKGILWSGRLNAGYVANEGNSPKERLNFDGQLGARTKNKRYTLSASYLFATEAGVKTEAKSRGTGKIDHFFTTKWYGTAHVLLEKNRFQDINLRTITGAGLGYQFWESKNLNLFVESGLDYVVEDYIVSPDKEYPAFRWALSFDKFLIADRLQSFHNHQLNVSLENSKDLLFSSQTGLRMLLTSNFNTTAEIDYDYDNQPADDTKKSDTTYKLSVGYSW